ncbi:MAG: AAA family ATPase [Actinomycetota bacterium]
MNRETREEQPVATKEPAGAAALLQGSLLLQKGRADVFRQRERTKLKRIVRAIVVVFLVDWYLFRRFSSGQAITAPSMPQDPMLLLFMVVIMAAVGMMFLMPLLNGRSPHVTVYPEQVETGLTDIKGLDMQVDEVVRSLDVFLGYATFKDELGGTPRRGILFEGPPGTGKTHLAKAMAKQAGVPFLFISSPAFQSMWQGMSAYRIRSYFKALRKAARKEGGAIGFIEEIDAIGQSRGNVSKSNPGGGADGLARTTSAFMGSGDSSAMVNELLIQLQSFDQPPLRKRLRARMIGWINAYLPSDRQLTAMKSEYHNILLIAATNRGDALDPALVRPGRFDRRLYFDVPTKQGRLDLIDYFLGRKRHHQQLDDRSMRERIAHETFGYTPVMIEHLFDESLLIALREGRRDMNFDDVIEAKFNEEIGLKQPVVYTDQDREAVATHEAGHATVAYFAGQNRRLEVLSIIKRRDSLGLLAHGDSEERFTRTRSEIESGIAIALGGLVAEEICIGDAGTGPAGDLAHATTLAANMVGSYGMAGSLISFDAISDGPIGGSNLVGKVLADKEGRQRVEDILEQQRQRVREVLELNADVHAALRDALIARDELVRDEILEVIERSLSARV